MNRRQRLAARLLTFGIGLAAVGLVLANVDSLLGDGMGSRSVRLVAGLVLLFEGLALTLDGSRPWVPHGRRLVRDRRLERRGTFFTWVPAYSSEPASAARVMHAAPSLSDHAGNEAAIRPRR